MVKSVIFDIDNTLYSYSDAHKYAWQALLQYVNRTLDMPGEAFAEAHKSAANELSDYMGDCAAIHNRLIRYINILESHDLPLYPHAGIMYDLYWNTLLEHAKPNDGAAELLKDLQERGIRIGIGSDMTAAMQIRKLEKLELLRYIDFIVTSEEAGAEKPSARFFERCIYKARCLPGECLFIGDHPRKDVRGSLNAGMQALLYDPDEKSNDPDLKKVRNFSEVIGILKDEEQ